MKANEQMLCYKRMSAVLKRLRRFCYVDVVGSLPADYTLNNGQSVSKRARCGNVFLDNLLLKRYDYRFWLRKNPTMTIPVTDFETVTLVQLDVTGGGITRTVVTNCTEY